MDGVTILNTYIGWTRLSVALLLFFNLFLAAGIVVGIALFANLEKLNISGVSCRDTNPKDT